MTSLVAAAPLLLEGPPGWVVYGILAVATLVVGEQALEKAFEKSQSVADTSTAETCKECDKDPCKKFACGVPGAKYRGGAHWCTSKPVNDGKDSHHMPAKTNSPLPADFGPAIQMDPADHRLTASYGRSPNDPYMIAQRALIQSGEFKAAIATDIADVTKRFPGKYDTAIAQMSLYADCLEKNHRI